MAKARLLAGVAVAALVLSGCTGAESPPEPPASAPLPVSVDREPIERWFPGLGDFTEVHWVAWPLSNPQVIGPTDTALQALVVLTEAQLSAVRDGYEWEPARADFDARLRDELRPHLPAAGDWQHSDEYESTVTTAQYWGSVYLDVASGTVYLDVSTH